MTSVLIVPGLGGSGQEHWQSHWERALSDSHRVQQRDWDHPNLTEWSYRLAHAVEQRPGAILVGHSLGCALILRVALAWRDLRIGGALLVAPADVESPQRTPRHTWEFGPFPRTALPFPATVVASSNDPYMSLERAHVLAIAWRANFINLGPVGHINVKSGFGPWPAGEKLLDALRREVRTSGRPKVADAYAAQ
ncbi:MAG: alpha/beta hydrolase [Xanthobacteraceae bacterium]|nr:alpha/beta hydrolase [Xanthobacteraceae bacterium]